MKTTITVNTVQGIGDIFWVYQKLAPYFDTINLNILYLVQATAIQLRSKAFCKMLPKVGTVTYSRASSAEYKRVTEIRVSLPDILDATTADYAVNAPLEIGINLIDIDPGFAIQTFVDLGLPACVRAEDYLCAFLSGTKNQLCWAPDRWLYAIKAIAKQIGTDHIVLVGAEWDKSVHDVIRSSLNGSYRFSDWTGELDLADSIEIIRRSRFFVGFQSGLNVLADNYDVPQLMVYYKHLEPMLYTWCKRANLKTQFKAMTFDDDIDSMILTLA